VVGRGVNLLEGRVFAVLVADVANLNVIQNPAVLIEVFLDDDFLGRLLFWWLGEQPVQEELQLGPGVSGLADHLAHL
jgi:hypothetical protein